MRMTSPVVSPLLSLSAPSSTEFSLSATLATTRKPVRVTLSNKRP